MEISALDVETPFDEELSSPSEPAAKSPVQEAALQGFASLGGFTLLAAGPFTPILLKKRLSVSSLGAAPGVAPAAVAEAPPPPVEPPAAVKTPEPAAPAPEAGAPARVPTPPPVAPVEPPVVEADTASPPPLSPLSNAASPAPGPAAPPSTPVAVVAAPPAPKLPPLVPPPAASVVPAPRTAPAASAAAASHQPAAAPRPAPPSAPAAARPSITPLSCSAGEKNGIVFIFFATAECGTIALGLAKAAVEKLAEVGGSHLSAEHKERVRGLVAGTDLKTWKIENLAPIKGLHPFILFMTIPKEQMRKILGSMFKAGPTLKEFGASLAERHRQGNLLPHVPQLATAMKKDPAAITAFITRQNWEGLVRYLYT